MGLRLDDQLCFALYAATNAITRAYRPLLRQIGLTYPQYLVLMALWQHGEQRVGDIAARLALPAHAIPPIVNRLATAGLVRRHRDLADRRIVTVRLTPAGRELERAAAQVQHSVACATGLTPDELGRLRGELHDLVTEMSGLDSDPADAQGEAS